MFLLIVILTYLFGSIPVGYILAKSQGVDIRSKGSGNIGGTNVYRIMGLKYGALVGILDVLKGVLPVIIGQLLHYNLTQLQCLTLAAIIGHIFPVFLKGKGGKGFATASGSFLIMAHPLYGLILTVLWIILLKITRIMSLTNLIIIFSIPFYFIFIQPSPAVNIGLASVIPLLIYWTHRSNIKRLLAGKEAVL